MKILFKLFIGGLLAYANLSQATGINQNKWYRIKPISQEGLCYDVSGGSDEDCTSVILYQQCCESKNQHFKFKKAPNGNGNSYFIIARHAPTKVLDICEGSMKNRDCLILYHNLYTRGFGSYNSNQQFYVSRAGGDLFRITNVKSSMALGFDENRNVCQMLLDYSLDTVVQLEVVDA
ncbi:MAG: RICIN domain-containing protein [Oligoflexales bacterium]